MSENLGVLAIGRPAAAPVQPAVERAARRLEATFAGELMKAARNKPQSGMFSGGIGAHTFDSFMDEALGEAMARQGGLGLARHIAQALGRAQAAASPSPVTAGGAAAAPPVPEAQTDER